MPGARLPSVRVRGVRHPPRGARSQRAPARRAASAWRAVSTRSCSRRAASAWRRSASTRSCSRRAASAWRRSVSTRSRSRRRRRFRPALLGLYALPLEARSCRLSLDGLRTLPFEPLAVGAQLSERTSDQVVWRTKLFETRQRGLPPAGLVIFARLLDGVARTGLGRNRRQRQDSFDNGFELGRFAAGLPGCEIGRLEVFEFQRHLDGVDENRQQDLAPRRPPRFVSHPRGMDRAVRPQDDRAPAGAELSLDDDVVGLARRDLSVPPHASTRAP